MVGSNVFAGVALIVALQPQEAAPSPAPTPKTIIQIETSPFCQAFRDSVFRAVAGLRVNDGVIDQGQSLLAKMAYDSVVDPPGRQGGGGLSVRMDEYRLGQVVGAAAHNLQRVHGLLDDAERVADHRRSDADRDLEAMKSALESVADGQERSLNLLSGLYETAALNDLLSRGDGTAGALGQLGLNGKPLELGDPILSSPGSLSLPVGGTERGSLFASTPVGHMAAAVTVSQQLTGSAERQVLSSVLPGINRCRDL